MSLKASEQHSCICCCFPQDGSIKRVENGIVVFRLKCQNYLKNLLKHRLLDPSVEFWFSGSGAAQDFTFLISSQVMLLPVAKGPHRTIGLGASEVMRVRRESGEKLCKRNVRSNGELGDWLDGECKKHQSPLYPDFLIEQRGRWFLY